MKMYEQACANAKISHYSVPTRVNIDKHKFEVSFPAEEIEVLKNNCTQ